MSSTTAAKPKQDAETSAEVQVVPYKDMDKKSQQNFDRAYSESAQLVIDSYREFLTNATKTDTAKEKAPGKRNTIMALEAATGTAYNAFLKAGEDLKKLCALAAVLVPDSVTNMLKGSDDEGYFDIPVLEAPEDDTDDEADDDDGGDQDDVAQDEMGGAGDGEAGDDKPFEVGALGAAQNVFKSWGEAFDEDASDAAHQPRSAPTPASPHAAPPRSAAAWNARPNSLADTSWNHDPARFPRPGSSASTSRRSGARPAGAPGADPSRAYREKAPIRDDAFCMLEVIMQAAATEAVGFDPASTIESMIEALTLTPNVALNTLTLGMMSCASSKNGLQSTMHSLEGVSVLDGYMKGDEPIYAAFGGTGHAAFMIEELPPRLERLRARYSRLSGGIANIGELTSRTKMPGREKRKEALLTWGAMDWTAVPVVRFKAAIVRALATADMLPAQVRTRTHAVPAYDPVKNKYVAPAP